MTVIPPSAVIVLQTFGSYTRGQLITDPGIIAAILAGGHGRSVVSTRIHAQYPGSASVSQEQ